MCRHTGNIHIAGKGCCWSQVGINTCIGTGVHLPDPHYILRLNPAGDSQPILPYLLLNFIVYSVYRTYANYVQ